MNREGSANAVVYLVVAIVLLLATAAGMLVAYLWHASPFVWLCAVPLAVFCGGWLALFLWMARTVA